MGVHFFSRQFLESLRRFHHPKRRRRGELGSPRTIAIMWAGGTIQLASTKDVLIGHNAQGTLVVNNGTSVTTGFYYIGIGSGTGMMLLDRAAATATNSLVVGDEGGTGRLVVQNGGTFTDGGMNIGAGFVGLAKQFLFLPPFFPPIPACCARCEIG